MSAIDQEALEATVETLRLTQDAIPARWTEDTSDQLPILVAITFDGFLAALLETPLPNATAGDAPPLAVRAALHGRAIATLLTGAASYLRDKGEPTDDYAPTDLISMWIDEIAVICLDPDRRPRHATADEYIRSSARTAASRPYSSRPRAHRATTPHRARFPDTA
jgi:hypothetical protein